MVWRNTRGRLVAAIAWLHAGLVVAVAAAAADAGVGVAGRLAMTEDAPTSPMLFSVAGALMMAFVAGGFGVWMGARWATWMVATLFALSAASTVGLVLATPLFGSASLAERWGDLAMMSPLVLLQLGAFAALVLPKRA